MPTKAKAVVIKKESSVDSSESGALLGSSFSPESLISQAIQLGTPVETMERLLAMRKELRQEQAKESFDMAMSELQGEMPVIKKTKIVLDKTGKERYRYAPIDSIIDQTKVFISKHGFSYSITTEQSEVVNEVKAICTVKHKQGHSENSTFRVPIDKEGYMTAPQKVGAALTFAKRYAFCNAFGIITGDDDTDATPESMGETRPPAAASRAGNYPPRQPQEPPAAAAPPPPPPKPPVPFSGRVKIVEITDMRIPRNDGDRIVVKTASYTLLLPEQLIDYVVVGWQFDVVGTLITNANGKQAVDVETVEPVEFVPATPPPAPEPEVKDETQGWPE